MTAFIGCGGDGNGGGESSCVDWPQWGQNAAHNGNSCGVGQIPTQTLDDITYDPFADQVAADNFGIVVHYQVPLIVGDDLYAELKTGSYIPCDPPGSGLPDGCGAASQNLEVWNEVHYKIGANGKLTQDWTFVSDWKPEPPYGFEPVFHAVVVGPFIYVPGANGSVYKIDRKHGNVIAQLAKVASAASPALTASAQSKSKSKSKSPSAVTVPVGDTYVAGPISADAKGNIYFNQLTMVHGQEWAQDATGVLVKITPDEQVTSVDYRTLTPGAPGPNDACIYSFDYNTYPLPWPPPPNADGTIPQPVQYLCGSQRPSLNIAPAIGSDGTIYTVSHAHYNESYAYLIAVTHDLKPKWNSSLRNLVNDGCGILSPADGQALYDHCRVDAPVGVDPTTGLPPAIGADDSSSSTPVVLPDGNILYGGLTTYNGSRGHLLKFSHEGKFLATFDFGWDVTPGVRVHDGTYSIITKDNHYGEGYAATGTYYITSLNPYLVPEWKFRSTNTQTCTRDAAGAISCVDDHPNGFEWCINAPAIDKDGNIYGNSEDGNMYVVDKNGVQKAAYFLDQAIAAAYTPVALDAKGRIFALNNGHLLVLGGDGKPQK
jgi:hypothetical protein